MPGRSVILLAVPLVLLAIALGAGLSWWTTAPLGLWPGTTIGGYLPPAQGSLGDWLEQLRQRRLRDQLPLVGPRETVVLSMGELGIELDVGATLADATKSRRHAGWSSVVSLFDALRGRLDVPLTYRIDTAKARGALEGIAPAFAKSPVDARLDIPLHRTVKAEFGEQLAFETTLLALARPTPELTLGVRVAIEPVTPRVTDEMVGGIDVSLVLAAYESDFRTRAGPRAINIRQAAAALDEVIIPPEGMLSFNRQVGPRLVERGYQMAPVIIDDELEPGVGGGVCQVASTLFAAAIHGGLEIVSRRSHSRPSGYLPLGLDATVLDGEVDLVLKNPYSVPLIVHTSFPGHYRLRVELLGRLPPAQFTHSYRVTKRYDTYRRVVTRPELSASVSERKQKGSPGYDVTSTVVAEYPDGRKVTREYRSRYFPVPEVFWVGSAVTRDVLGPLAEGAVAMTWDGETIEGELPTAATRRKNPSTTTAETEPSLP